MEEIISAKKRNAHLYSKTYFQMKWLWYFCFVQFQLSKTPRKSFPDYIVSDYYLWYIMAFRKNAQSLNPITTVYIIFTT